jgi:lysophospholipase L1-like esterase
VRTYRSAIRIIQAAALITLIIAVVGLIQLWRGEPEQVGGAGGGEPTAEGDRTLVPEAGGGDDAPVEPVNTKIVCFGDSFTLGYPGKAEDSWPAVLQTLIKVEVINKGATAQPSYKLLERFDADVLAETPGRVIILAGNGDALDNNEGRSLEDYQRDMIALINKAEASHIKPILALPLPFPGVTERIAEYRAWLQSYAAEKNIMLLDFKPTLCGDGEQLLTQYAAPDNSKYPSKEGYAAIAAYAASVL